MSHSLILSVLACAASLLVIHIARARQWKAKLPPGPPGYPLIGNILDMPTSFEWIHFAKWRDNWGDLTSATVPGTTIVNIHTYKKAVELLVEKNSIYSDRPILPMFGELIGWNDSLPIMPYSSKHREAKKMFHVEMGTDEAVQRVQGSQEAMTTAFLRRLLKSPDDFYALTNHYTGSIMLKLAYGYTAEDKNDPILSLIEKALEHVPPATNPAGFYVNQFPFLRHIPVWFPGAYFHQKAAEWKQDYLRMVNVPFNTVAKNVDEGTATDSFTARWLRGNTLTPEQNELLRHTSSILFVGGTETTASLLHVFFYAMTLNQNVQKEAQAELDAIIGKDGMPRARDREDLPYVGALVKEVLRYEPPLPYAIPHRVTEDDIHDGYLIPKGATMLPNIWQMSRDPQVYNNPSKFDPSRFLGPNPEQDPADYVFGFGRRECPGIRVAQNTLFLTIARTLATFNIAPIIGKNGKPDPPKFVALPGITNHIQEFCCSITPRNPNVTLEDHVDD